MHREGQLARKMNVGEGMGTERNHGRKNKPDGAKVSAHSLLYFVDFTAMSQLVKVQLAPMLTSEPDARSG